MFKHFLCVFHYCTVLAFRGRCQSTSNCEQGLVCDDTTKTCTYPFIQQFNGELETAHVEEEFDMKEENGQQQQQQQQQQQPAEGPINLVFHRDGLEAAEERDPQCELLF